MSALRLSFSKLFEFVEFECSSWFFGRGFLRVDRIGGEVL